jgi:tripartite-type tricarboxylate transporter receptor subunit TctC
MMEAEFGYEVTYVPYPGGGAVAKELADKRIDSTVNNPAEQSGFMQAGKTKPLVAFTDERLEAYADVPTAKELGHDIVYYMQRSISGPPGMSAEAQQWYVDLFRQLYESEEWQTFCADEGLDCGTWVASEDLGRFHATQLERHKRLIETVAPEAPAGQ